MHRVYGSSEVAHRRAVRPPVRVQHLRGADAGLPLLSRTSSAVDACARGLILACRALGAVPRLPLIGLGRDGPTVGVYAPHRTPPLKSHVSSHSGARGTSRPLHNFVQAFPTRGAAR